MTELEKLQEKYQIKDEDKDILVRYIYEKKLCDGCKGLEDCKQFSQGYQPNLVVYGYPEIRLEKCPYLLKNTAQAQKMGKLRLEGFPESTQNISLDHFDTSTPLRLELYQKSLKWISQLNQNEQAKGIYLVGGVYTGKTYFALGFAKELLTISKSVYMIFYPDFTRNLLSSMNNQASLNEKIESCKTVDVLILDDFGSEQNSTWIRDEVLLPILQYRAMAGYPTIYTSNYTFPQLLNHFASDEDKTKAMKLLTLIKNTTNIFEIK